MGVTMQGQLIAKKAELDGWGGATRATPHFQEKNRCM